jgi:plastocyanin
MKKNVIIVVVLILVVVAIVLNNKKPKVEEQGQVIDTNTVKTENPSSTKNSVEQATTAPAAKDVVFTVYGGNYYFDPNIIKVKQGTRVTIVFHNKEGLHNLKFEGYNVSTSIIPAYGEEKFSFIADKKGSFEYYCSSNNHRQLGMKGTMIVE